jgi:AraC-like DNA-binding protein
MSEMKTYLTPQHPFHCVESEVIFSGQTASVALAQLARLKFEFVNFHHAVVGPEWSTNGQLEGDYRHKVSFVCSGSASLIFDGVALELKPGYAYWTPSSTLVERHCEKRYEEFHLTFYCELIDGIDLFSDWPERRPFCVGRWDMDSWRSQWAQKPLSLNAHVRLQGQLYQWMAENFEDLDKIVARHSQMFTRYTRVFELTESQLTADLRISDMARAHGISLEAFSKAFMRDLGISPKTYLNRRLNQQACQFLIATDWPVKMVAHKLGFLDEYYFSRFFAKMNGLSPAKYRKNSRS